MLTDKQEILFTRQRHDAKRAGLHYDIRFVSGDKAYSFATKKDLPTPGSAILLHEQPVHTAHYALSERVDIPEGQYGAGTTTLDFVRKAQVAEGSTPDKIVIQSNGEKYLLKKLGGKYGPKSWLFKNLSTNAATEGEGINKYLDKVASILVKESMYERAKYHDHGKKEWTSIADPVGTNKYDGASFFAKVEPDGSLRYFSRRPSVKGGFPERTESIPHLSGKKLPQFAGDVYNVELIHTGEDPYGKESHSMASGILNSLPERAKTTQQATGPIRAIVHNVISPALPTYQDKLDYMKAVEQAYGSPEVFRSVEPHFGQEAIRSLLSKTQSEGREGVVVTSLTAPEGSNPRIKIKHQEYYNLVVVGFEEELDKNGKPKGRLGSLIVADSTGRIVAKVGTGLSHALRQEIWDNRPSWLGRLIQVKTMGLARNMLRMPVYNGEADGGLDTV